MANWKPLRQRCLTCEGNGICSGSGPGSCIACLGTGYTLDSRLEVEVDERIDTVLAELDYIHGKVTAIWNAVKPPN